MGFNERNWSARNILVWPANDHTFHYSAQTTWDNGQQLVITKGIHVCTGDDAKWMDVIREWRSDVCITRFAVDRGIAEGRAIIRVNGRWTGSDGGRHQIHMHLGAYESIEHVRSVRCLALESPEEKDCRLVHELKWMPEDEKQAFLARRHSTYSQ